MAIRSDARAALKKKWNEKLGIATIEGATDDERRIFYSGLYHALLYPKLFSEYGRYYSAFDDQIHNGESYTAYSIWDTFRAENSLLTLFAPERIDGMISALLQNYKEGGWLPKWPNPSYTNIMIGTHADSLIAESIRKGFKGFDYSPRLRGTLQGRQHATRRRHNAALVGSGARRALRGPCRPDLRAQARLHPGRQSLGVGLEHPGRDLRRLRRGPGRQKTRNKSSDYRDLMQRSRNYKNLFNPERGFMQARNSDGSWANPADGWTEGDEWVYLFAPLHDIPGVIESSGRPQEAFNAMLDEHFAGHHNHHDNEPSHHYGYLYDFGGQPWKTQAIVRQISHATPTPIPRPACWGMKIAARCPPGTSSQPWVSIRSIQPRPNT